MYLHSLHFWKILLSIHKAKVFRIQTFQLVMYVKHAINSPRRFVKQNDRKIGIFGAAQSSDYSFIR